MRSLVVVLILTLAGCVSPKTIEKTGASIQAALDFALPPDFEGDASLTTSINNSPAKITIRAGGLRRVDGRWSYKWLVWNREGFWSRGTLILGSPSPTLIP